MSPDDPRCVVIAIILQRVQQTGSVAVYVRSNGWYVCGVGGREEHMFSCQSMLQFSRECTSSL